MLRGGIAAQIELAWALLSAAPLGRRYVLERDGEVVGMGSLATRDEPRPETPARVLLRAPLGMGAVNGAWTVLGAARGLLTAAGPPGPDEGQIHSVVVDEARRGEGLGAVILRHLEKDAVGLRKRRAALQVISSNTTARAFYCGAGYAEDGHPHSRLRNRLAYPSVLMGKYLLSP
jgi:ribosomal protein S18 acetylase RimI-like enzyme